jgi:spore coat protein U-like protein
MNILASSPSGKPPAHRHAPWHWLVGLALLSLAFGFAGPAHALTSCTASMTALAFGDVDPLAMRTATATLTVTCNSLNLGVLGNVKVRACVNIGKGAQPRAMPRTGAGGTTLSFQMYKDASAAEIWGSRSATAPANTPLLIDIDYNVTLLVGSTTRTYTLYGRTPVQSAAVAASYSDTYAGADAEMVYRYNEPLAVLPTAYPASCLTGGDGGASGAYFPFAVSARVPGSCALSAASTLGFGSHPGPVTAAYQGQTTLDMLCRNGTAWVLSLDNGQHFDGSSRRMRMGTGTDHVRYGLYRNPGRTLAWGSNSGVDTLAGNGTGSNQATVVYGQVTAGQSVPAGDYQDVVRVTVTY